MEKTKITLKEHFISRREDYSGTIKLKNNKVLNLVFNTQSQSILISTSTTQKSHLTQSERIEIIEEILIKYTTVLNSILKFSTRHCLEVYRLVDMTSNKKCIYKKGQLIELDEEDYTKGDTILQEYLEQYEDTQLLTFKCLKEIYQYLKGKRLLMNNNFSFKYDLNYNLNKIQLLDLNYYLHVLVKLMTDIDFDINIERKTQLSITPVQKN